MELSEKIRQEYVKALDKKQTVCHLFDKEKARTMFVMKDNSDDWDKIDLRKYAFSQDAVSRWRDDEW